MGLKISFGMVFLAMFVSCVTVEEYSNWLESDTKEAYFPYFPRKQTITEINFELDTFTCHKPINLKSTNLTIQSRTQEIFSTIPIKFPHKNKIAGYHPKLFAKLIRIRDGKTLAHSEIFNGSSDKRVLLKCISLLSLHPDIEIEKNSGRLKPDPR